MFASAAFAVLFGTALVVAAGGDEAVEAPGAGAASAAIRRAVEARVGKGVAVSVWSMTGLRFSGAPDTETIVAVPDPAARFGAPARFVLNQQLPGKRPTRIGDVTATIQAVGPVVVTTRDIARGATLARADVAIAATDLSGRAFRPLPTIDEAIGARVTRDLVMRDLLTHNDISASPIVRAGDVVRAIARVGGVEVSAQLVAAEGGRRNDVIRVVNQDTRFQVRARVLEKGEVEVLNVR